MKNILTLFFILISISASANDLGKILKPRFKDGAPDIWVRYTPSKQHVELNYTTNIDSTELDNIPTMVEGFFVDVKTKTPLSHKFLYWNGAIASGYFFTDNEEDGAAILKNFRNLGVAFQADGVPLYWIPLGEICSRYPKLFFNVDENHYGCPY